MICLDCKNCNSLKMDNDLYKITCPKGSFSVHSSHSDNFICDDYEVLEETVPLKDNILIILKSGRDITTLDVDIKSLKDMGDRMNKASNLGGETNYVRFGSLEFNIDEIAVWGYL